MIEAIRNIGEYALEKDEKSVDDPLRILIDNPANRNTKNILFILLNEEKGEFKYDGVEVEEYSEDKLEKYLYRKGSGARGTDITPTAMVTDKIEKTFNIKILSWFKNYISGENNKNDMLHNICFFIKENNEKILQDLQNKSEKENNIISFKINGKYLGDFEIFRNILVNKASENFYKKFGKISKSKDKLCSICKKKSDEVYGFVSTFNFYTVDKPGFVSGGFQQKDAWKNYPVCLNCALTLEEGKKYLEDNLNFNFLEPGYGVRYLLILKFVKVIDKKVRKEIFRKIEQQRDPKFRKVEINRFTSDENEILELMSEQENFLNNNFLFYSVSNKAFRILFYIEDILPSRLKQLFEAKEKIDQEEIFKNCMVPISNNKGKKDGEKPLEFNSDVLQPFFYDFKNKRWISKKYFLDIVNKIFTNKPVNYDFLLNFIVQKIREDFINGYLTKKNTLKGFMLLNYLKKLNLLKYKREEIIEMEKSILFEEMGGKMKEKTESFFNEFSDFFDSNIKKAIFLEGALTQKLLNIQRLSEVSNAQAGKEPFRSRLKGLKLDEKQIRKLLPEIQNKLEEYGKNYNYYRDLESIISNYFVSSGNDWNVSNDEISFYFVLGMNLSNLFKKEKNNGGKEDE